MYIQQIINDQYIITQYHTSNECPLKNTSELLSNRAINSFNKSIKIHPNHLPTFKSPNKNILWRPKILAKILVKILKRKSTTFRSQPEKDEKARNYYFQEMAL